MSYVHLLTCLVLAYAPQYIIYGSSKLGDNTQYARTNILWGFVAHLLTAFVKLLLLATFGTTQDSSAVASSDAFIIGTSIFAGDALYTAQETILKVILNAVDIIGVYLVLSIGRVSGDTEFRILGVGLGWSFFENVFSRFMPIWFGARGLEFEWSSIQMAVLSNIQLLLHIAFVACVYIFAKSKKSQQASKRTSMMLLAYFTVVPVLTEVIKVFAVPAAFKSNVWIVLAIHACLTLGGALATKVLFKSQYAKDV